MSTAFPCSRPTVFLCVVLLLGACSPDGKSPSAFNTSEARAALQSSLQRDEIKAAIETISRQADERVRQASAAAQQEEDAKHQHYIERAEALRTHITKSGGLRRYLDARRTQLEMLARSGPPPERESARVELSSILSFATPCARGEPTVYSSPESVHPNYGGYQIWGCNLFSGGDLHSPSGVPKVALVLPSGKRLELWAGLIEISNTDPRFFGVVFGTPDIVGELDGNATLQITTPDGKKLPDLPLQFAAAREDLRLEPPLLQGNCSDAAATNSCGGGGGLVTNSFVAYHHQICCGSVSGTDRYWLPAPLKNGWQILFSNVATWPDYTGSSCGPIGGAGKLGPVTGTEKESTQVDIHVGWSTQWICSEIFYIGIIWLRGPKGTSPQ